MRKQECVPIRLFHNIITIAIFNEFSSLRQSSSGCFFYFVHIKILKK